MAKSKNKTKEQLINELAAMQHQVAELKKLEAARRQAEESLRESEQLFRSLAETTSDWVWEVNRNGSYTYASPKVQDFLGYEPEQVVGKTPFDFMPPHEAKCIAALLKDIVKFHKPFSGLENINLHKDGREIILETSGVPIFDERGGFSGYRGIDRDITKRKQAEKNLIESEERYRIAIEHSNDGVAIVKGYHHIYVNRKFLEIFGYESADEIVGNQIYITVHPDDRETVIDINQRRQKGEVVPSKYEFKGIRKDGTPVFIEVSAANINYRGGPAALAYLRDITEHKRIDNALKESEKKYRDLVDNALVGVYVTDLKGGISYVNETFLHIFEFSTKEKIMSAGSLVRYRNPKDRRIFIENLKRSGKVSNYELELVTKTGQTVNVLLNATLKGNIISGMMLDITKRKQAEKSLRESEEKYRNIFENAVEGIFQSTPAGRYLSVNPSLARMYGFESPQEIMTSITDIEKQLYVNPEERRNFRELLEKNGIVEGFEIQEYRKDGFKIWISLNARAVMDADGTTLYYEGTVEDISKRKRAEEEKMRLESQLRQSQKMEAIGQLAGGIAHDFNNILSGIKGLAKIALDKTPAKNPVHRKIELILRGAQRGHDLVKQILTFSRKGEPDQKPVSMGHIVKEALRMIRVSVPSNIEICDNVLTGDDIVLADQNQIYQVLLNLCINAAHAMRDRGGVLEVSLTDEHFTSSEYLLRSGLKEGPYIMIAVSDTGYGMSPEVMDRVFDPFFTTKKPGEGTGLGLSIVHSIVKGHNGLITVSSEMQKGSSFHVYLPKHQQVMPVVTDAPSGESKGKGRINSANGGDTQTGMSGYHNG